MSIYNLQTRTGLNKSCIINYTFVYQNLKLLLKAAPGTKRSGIRYIYVLTDGQIDRIPTGIDAFVLVMTYSKHSQIISVFLYL